MILVNVSLVNFSKKSCKNFGIILKEIPCESHNSMGPGERYHAPLRRIYKKLKMENPKLDNETCLSIAVHGLNNTANPQGLIPTLLVFGCIPKIPLGNIKHLCPTQRERCAAMESAQKEMEVRVAEQRLKLASKLRTKERTMFNIMPGTDVLVYREKSKQWESPFKLISYDGYKTAKVRMGKEVEPFSVTAVKEYLKETEQLGTTGETTGEEDLGEGSRIEVYWPLDYKYYPGTIAKYDKESKTHIIEYDDGEREH